MKSNLANFLLFTCWMLLSIAVIVFGQLSINQYDFQAELLTVYSLTFFGHLLLLLFSWTTGNKDLFGIGILIFIVSNFFYGYETIWISQYLVRIFSILYFLFTCYVCFRLANEVNQKVIGREK